MKKVTRSLAIALILMIAMSLIGCKQAPKPIKKPAGGEVTHAINGSCTLTIEGDTATVSGTTGLMQGTVIKISIFSASGKELASEIQEVTEEAYTASFAVDPAWNGEIYGFLSCTPSSNGSQPKEVKEAYGKNFANLEGENVIWNAKEVMFVLMRESLTIGA